MYVCPNRLGIGNLLEVMQEDEDSDDFDDAEDGATNNGDFERKADTAEDFSDINELAEDIQIAQVHIGPHWQRRGKRTL